MTRTLVRRGDIVKQKRKMLSNISMRGLYQHLEFAPVSWLELTYGSGLPFTPSSVQAISYQAALYNKRSTNRLSNSHMVEDRLRTSLGLLKCTFRKVIVISSDPWTEGCPLVAAGDHLQWYNWSCLWSKRKRHLWILVVFSRLRWFLDVIL